MWAYLYGVNVAGVGHRHLGGREGAALVAVDVVMCSVSGKLGTRPAQGVRKPSQEPRTKASGFTGLRKSPPQTGEA